MDFRDSYVRRRVSVRRKVWYYKVPKMKILEADGSCSNPALIPIASLLSAHLRQRSCSHLDSGVPLWHCLGTWHRRTPRSRHAQVTEHCVHCSLLSRCTVPLAPETRQVRSCTQHCSKQELFQLLVFKKLSSLKLLDLDLSNLSSYIWEKEKQTPQERLNFKYFQYKYVP